MNASHVPWLQLPGQQNILVQALFTETDYSVRVTDLSNVWSETLSRKKIKARAEEVDCPIDADANLPDLLERLQNALTVDSKTTEIVLHRRSDQLRLTTTETIGRVNLEWEFRMSALPYSAVACGLTLSLFSMVSYYQRCVQTLLEVIQDKDTLIRQMNDFVKTSNLTFKPNRRQGAFKKFDRLEWLDRCRSKAAREALDSQEVIDALSLVGRDADFRKDWRSVLTKAADWQVSFLPDTIEQTPSKVTSSLKKKGRRSRSKTRFEEIAAGSDAPHLTKEDTTAEAAEFQSPKRKRVIEKKKIHTKWSSPVPSYASSEDDSSSSSSDIEDDDDEIKDLKRASASPTPKQRDSKQIGEDKRDGSDSPLELYKIRDNRESQELESDIDLYNQTPTKPKVVQDLAHHSSSEDTQDESDEELTVKSQTQTSGPMVASSPPQTPSKKTSDAARSRASSVMSSPIKNRIGGTPQKKQPNRIKNIISPRKPRAEEPSSPVGPQHESSNADSQIVDLEAEKKALAMKRRAEAERIENSPSKSKLKRARRF